MRAFAIVLVILAACGGAAASPDASAIDATPPVPDAGKDAACASTFGGALTNAFGRLDGTVVAIVQPGDPHCAQLNSDHVVVQVQMGGAVYRMVVNVLSDSGDPMIRVRELDAPLPAPAFADGWHTGILLDYPTSLGLHSIDADWQPMSLADATARIGDAIEIGDPISVYATSTGGTKADSAHLIHREGSNHDGAIVLSPGSANARWLVFDFSDDTF